MEGRYRRAGNAGFTLVEVLVAIAVLGAVGVAIGAISITGVLQVGEDAEERREDSTTAQWVSMYFARDVQGASAVAADAGCGPGSRVITLEQSDGSATIEYRAVGSGPYDLVRHECGGSSQTIVTGLIDQPECSPDPDCPQGEPRQVTLRVERTATFSFDLDAVRRPNESGGVPDPLSDAPQFLSLGGDPLTIGGSSRLEITGAAYLNKPSSGTTAIDINGNGEKLVVTGDFRLEQGATCDGCDTKANKQPGSFATAIPDPLRFLPAPSTAGLPTNPGCPSQGGVRVCSEGIYTDPFPPVNGNVAVELLPGTYVLQAGLDMNNGSLSTPSGGVLFYNESGAFDITGGDFSLSAASSGAYSGILLYQPESNSSAVSVNGNATVASLNGTLYAPGSSGFVMAGSGASTLRVGRVIGASLSTSGSGTVIVNGAP